MSSDESSRSMAAELRKNAGLSQSQLAARLRMKQATISDWETGKHTPTLKLSQVKRLLDSLKCTLDEAIAAYEPEELEP